MLHDIELDCIVSKSSSTRSVSSIFPCIRLHKYVCTDLQIRLSLLVALQSICMNTYST